MEGQKGGERDLTKPYKVFISHTGSDAPIAKVIVRTVNDAFDGHIALYMARERLIIGKKWKDEISERLRQ